MCEINLPKVVTWKWNGRESNLRLFVSQANTPTITPPGHFINISQILCSKYIFASVNDTLQTSLQNVQNEPTGRKSFKKGDITPVTTY